MAMVCRKAATRHVMYSLMSRTWKVDMVTLHSRHCDKSHGPSKQQRTRSHSYIQPITDAVAADESIYTVTIGAGGTLDVGGCQSGLQSVSSKGVTEHPLRDGSALHSADFMAL